MSDTILLSIAAALVAATAIVVLSALARRPAPAAANGSPAALEGIDGEPSGGSREFTPLADPNEWQSATVSDLAEAEELLDWAEAQGYEERELILLADATFLVRW